MNGYLLHEGSSPSVKTKPLERTDSSTCSSNSDCPKAQACLKSDFLWNDNEKQETRKIEEKRLHVMKKLHWKGTSLLRSEASPDENRKDM